MECDLHLRELAVALVLVGALCVEPARAGSESASGSSSTGPVSLRIDAPAPGEHLQQAEPLVRVRGRVGAELFDADIVIALDASNSALLASGVDLDGDGVLGVTRRFAEDAGRFVKPYLAWTTDPDDSILQAEITATRALLGALEVREDRVGLLTYTSRPKLRAALGAPAQAGRALDAVPIVEDLTGTDLARALRTAAGMLTGPGIAAESGRPRAILLGTDGEPTVPTPRYSAKRAALREASRLAAEGISLYVLAFGTRVLGDEGAEELEFLRTLAEAGDGVLVPVDHPSQLLQDLPPVQAQRAALEIENVTLRESPRSLALSADGAFEAWLPLAPGANELRVRASWRDGRAQSLSRSVHYQAVDRPAEIGLAAELERPQ